MIVPLAIVAAALVAGVLLWQRRRRRLRRYTDRLNRAVERHQRDRARTMHWRWGHHDDID